MPRVYSDGTSGPAAKRTSIPEHEYELHPETHGFIHISVMLICPILEDLSLYGTSHLGHGECDKLRLRTGLHCTGTACGLIDSYYRWLELLSQALAPSSLLDAMEGFVEGVTDSVERAILVLELGLLIKLIVLAASFRPATWSIRSVWACVKKQGLEQWKNRKRRCLEKADASDQSEQELARMRCTWTRGAWWMVLVITLVRLLSVQLGDRSRPAFDLALLCMASLGLVLVWCPRLINPWSQDVFYVATILVVDAAILISSMSYSVDFRDVITFTFAGRFLYAVLAMRASCVVLCTTVNFLQAVQLLRHSEDSQDAVGSDINMANLVPIFLLMLAGILSLRKLLLQNVSLKMDLQKRTVELGAVSSLLTACYDAVLEVDHTLRLCHDPWHLKCVKSVCGYGSKLNPHGLQVLVVSIHQDIILGTRFNTLRDSQ